MTVEAETGVVHLQARELQALPTTPEARRKSWNTFSIRAFREHVALQTPLTLDC